MIDHILYIGILLQYDLLFFQALDLTVQLMEMGEKALIQTDAKYAYGTRGR